MDADTDIPLAADGVILVRVREGNPAYELPARIVAALGGELVLELAVVPLRRDDLLPGHFVELVAPGISGTAGNAFILDGGRGARLIVRTGEAQLEEQAGNRRAFYRVGMGLGPADLFARQGTRAALRRSRLVDLSGGGAHLLVPALPSLNELLSLHVPALEQRGLAQVPARVAWSRPAGAQWHLGLEFTDLREPDRDRIVGAVLLREVRGKA